MEGTLAIIIEMVVVQGRSFIQMEDLEKKEKRKRNAKKGMKNSAAGYTFKP